MAIDLKNHRLFLGCGNKMMVMMDSTNGKVLATVPIGEGVDGNAFDPGTQLAFASCGDRRRSRLRTRTAGQTDRRANAENRTRRADDGD